MYPVGMRKLFNGCGSWNPGSYQITSFQLRTHVFCGWPERILALMQVQLKRSLCLKVRRTLRSNRKNMNRRIAKKEEQDFWWNDTKKESSISFERITLVKCVWHVALKLSFIWFTRTILSIALVWTRIPISFQIGEEFWVRFNEVPLFYHSLSEGRSRST